MATNDKVVVYCKLPCGMWLTNKDSDGVDHAIRVNGPNNKPRHGQLAIFGCGVTEIDKEHWETWIKNHAKMDIVKNGHIFISNKSSDTGQAREKKKNFSGLEGINPFKPAREIEPDLDAMKATGKRVGPDGLVLSRPLAGEEEM